MINRFLVFLCAALSCLLMDAAMAGKEQPVAIAAMSAVASAQLVPAATQPSNGIPVKFADSEIFVVKSSPLESLTLEGRARLIQQNIQAFASGNTDPKELKVIPLPEGYGIGSGDGMLMVITARDAEGSGKAAPELASDVMKRILLAVKNYRSRNAWKTYGLGAGFTFLSILALWQALRWNNRAFAWLTAKVSFMRGHWKRGVHFKGIEILSARKIESHALLALRFFRILVILVCLYFFLPLILSFFPETQALSSKIFGYLVTPFVTIFLTVVKYIPNLFYIFVIGVISFYVLKLISYVFTLLERGELKFDWFYDDWARPSYQIVRVLVIVTALISAYPYIPGSSSQAFQGVGLVLGAIISFASSSAISNIVAGVILTYTRAFRLNDRIKIGDTTGDVVEKTLLVTRIKTIKQVVVTIPNSLVMGAQIINFSTSAASGEGVILHTSVTIGYDVPWSQVQSLLIEAALKTEKVLKQPEPFVLQTSLDDFYVSYEINAYTKEPEKMAVIYSDLHQNILETFDRASVEIMSPHYYALRDGNAAAVPSILGKSGYTPPSFNISGGHGVNKL